MGGFGAHAYIGVSTEAAMTAQYKGKVFKAGNSAGVRLPKDIAFALGTEITIERRGDTITVKPAVDREAALANNRALVEEIRAIWDRHGGAPPVPQEREADIFPDRPGL